jgi:uncharacterized protein YbgA (DUF1722 family)/uncharacterized protein YbbK (DUF523 family)
MEDKARLRVGISRCLLGDTVRWDGGHKRDRFLVDTFGPYVEWVPVCPEVESGLPVPRETLRLVQSPDRDAGDRRLRLEFTRTGADWTDRMTSWAATRLQALERETLHGFVLKKDSPSCGLERVRVYGERGGVTRQGRGLFAEALVRRFPNLPVEEEGRLAEPRLRENFVERVFAYRRLQALFAGRWTTGALVRFHTAHKLTLLAHSPTAYRALGRLVAVAATLPRAELRQRYAADFMSALSVMATPRKHANVLMHMLGYLRGAIDAGARADILELIDAHRREVVPLIVPLTLIAHYVRRTPTAYLQGQVYLDPHPKELSLRSRV